VCGRNLLCSGLIPVAQRGLKEKDTPGCFIISLEWNEPLYEATYVANGVKMSSPAEMTSSIMKSKKLQVNPQTFRVIIIADKKVPYEFTRQAMAAVAEADAANILLSTTEDKSDNSTLK